MIEKEAIIAAREIIGGYLSTMRKEKGISKYKLIQEFGLRMDIIDSIEKGTSSYTIDSFLKYTTGIGAYFFWRQVEKKESG